MMVSAHMLKLGDYLDINSVVWLFVVLYTFTAGTLGGLGTYNLREWYEGHTPRGKLTASRSERGASILPSTPLLQNPTRGTQGATGSPHGAHKPASPCQQAQMCYAEPSPPHRTERPGTRARAELP